MRSINMVALQHHRRHQSKSQRRGTRATFAMAATAATHHLLRSHAHRLDRELASAHVEQVLERGTEQVDHEHVVQAFLTKVIYLRNAGCCSGLESGVRSIGNRVGAAARREARREGGGGTRTRTGQDLVCPVLIAELRGVALARFLRVRFGGHVNSAACRSQLCVTRSCARSEEGSRVDKLTNLIATVCELSKFWPMRGELGSAHPEGGVGSQKQQGRGELDRPSKITPNEPSPIFLPTRKWTPMMFELDDEWLDDEAWCWEVDMMASPGTT